jgi:hypothetical protein
MDEMQIAQLIVSSIMTVVVAALGWHFIASYRILTRIKLLETRVQAYRKLFEITEPTSPTRLGRGEALDPEDARRLGRMIYEWYYKDGNGLLMPNSTRVYLQSLQQRLQGEPERRQSSDPILREVSHLRSLLRQDVGVFAEDEFGGAWPDRTRRARRQFRGFRR